MKFSKVIFLLVITMLIGSFSINKKAKNNVILVGKNHPYNPIDDIILPHIADSIIKKTAYFSQKQQFSTGKNFINKLVQITKKHGSIGNLAIMGHSGYHGFFVKGESGFYRNEYPKEKSKPEVLITAEAALISDLQKAISQKQIIFSKTSFILLLGCNTAYGNKNIAFDLATVTQIPVIGSAQKLDLYNVKNRGEDLLGEDNGSFIVYYPKNGLIEKRELGFKSSTISFLVQSVLKE